jgi:hypothetical protein
MVAAIMVTIVVAIVAAIAATIAATMMALQAMLMIDHRCMRMQCTTTLSNQDRAEPSTSISPSYTHPIHSSTYMHSLHAGPSRPALVLRLPLYSPKLRC